MEEPGYKDFMELHEAMKLRGKLEELLPEAQEEIVEGYMLDDEKCNEYYLEGYLMDDLDDDEIKRLKEHMEKCETCRKTLDEIIEIKDAFQVNFQENFQENEPTVISPAAPREDESEEEMGPSEQTGSRSRTP